MFGIWFLGGGRLFSKVTYPKQKGTRLALFDCANHRRITIFINEFSALNLSQSGKTSMHGVILEG